MGGGTVHDILMSDIPSDQADQFSYSITAVEGGQCHKTIIFAICRPIDLDWGGVFASRSQRVKGNKSKN